MSKGSYIGGSSVIRTSVHLQHGQSQKWRDGILKELAPQNPSEFEGKTEVIRKENTPEKKERPKAKKFATLKRQARKDRSAKLAAREAADPEFAAKRKAAAERIKEREERNRPVVELKKKRRKLSKSE